MDRLILVVFLGTILAISHVPGACRVSMSVYRRLVSLAFPVLSALLSNVILTR